MILADGAAALLSCLLRLMWPLSWRWQGSFRDTWRARSHFCILKDINQWHFRFGNHSVFPCALTEDTKCKWTKSFAGPVSASAEHQADCFHCLSTSCFFFCLFEIKIENKLSSLSSLSLAPPSGNTGSTQVLFPHRAGKPPGAKNRVQDDNCHAGDVTEPRSVSGL